MALVDYCFGCGSMKNIKGLCDCYTDKPRTQKGKGIVVLRGMTGSVINAKFIKDADHMPTVGWPFFCRPAPSLPRHGYIDSRVLKTPAAATALLAEVLADDPEGELILCPPVKAKWNAVLTPTSLVVGSGNDGATAGKNAAVIPLVELPGLVPAGNKMQAGIAGKDWPYLEIVQAADMLPVFVQLRGGPAGLPQGNYVPVLTQVTTVLKADPKVYKDLAWEKAIEEATPGTVVWHPGGAMSDHFSIHAFTHKVPVIFDAVSPKVGDVLEPPASGVPEFDPEAMLRGFIAGELLPLGALTGTSMSGAGGSSLVTAMLVGLHNATAMTGAASVWVGLSAALMIRLGVTALRGEARHHTSQHDGSKPARSTVYQKYAKRSVGYHRASLNRLINVFRYGTWPSAGFGGPKWACCGASIAGLFNAVQELAQTPTPANAAKLVAKLNVAVNQAHNGGWWLNKFASAELFDQIPKGRLDALAHSIDTFGIAHKILRQLDAKPGFVTKKIAQYASWTETKLSPPYTKSVRVRFHPTLGTIKMVLSTRLLGTKTRTINAHVVSDSVSPELLAVMKEGTYLVEGADGYRLEVKPSTGAPVVIWTEDSLATLATQNVVKKG